MAKIINKQNRRIMISLKSGKYVDLLAGGELKIDDDDIASPHLQTFIKGGEIAVAEKKQQKSPGKEKKALPKTSERRAKKRKK